MELRLYNTLSRSAGAFVPGDPGRVTLYVCGPTVYNFPHIGNARPAVVFDVLYRLLRRLYPKVVYARNITDVDDKINAAAREQKTDIRSITERFAAVYEEDMRALGVLRPDLEPRATDNIDAMIAVIRGLVDAGCAYAVEGHVLFSIQAFPQYGALSRRNRDEMIAGARVEVAPYKKDPADFVLWKPSGEGDPGWDSPWGRGRPGWHLECSTMIQEHLGVPVDIHGGGQDLIFPHHENEIAQAACASGGRDLARYWLHNGFLSVDNEKMSKSLGNVVLVRDLLEDFPGEAIRLALLSAHYRRPLSWSDELIGQAVQGLDRLYRALEPVAGIAAAESDPAPGVLEALCDDLNTPRALAELHECAHRLNKAGSGAEQSAAKAELLASAGLLGLLARDPADWMRRAQKNHEPDAAAIEERLAARERARREKDFAAADRIRAELQQQGILIEDHPQGTSWRLAR